MTSYNHSPRTNVPHHAVDHAQRFGSPSLVLAPRRRAASPVVAHGRHPFGPLRCLKSGAGHRLQDVNAAAGGGVEEDGRLLVVERYKDGSSKRYILDKKSQLQSLWEENRSSVNEITEEDLSSNLTLLPITLKEFILPAGFPGSVSDDYLDYMLLQFPTNVTGWVCHTLVTSSLLKAVGVGSFSGTTTATSAAAIRWVSKDGLGAIGRLLIGGRFGKLFDDDPKQWRMYADFVGSAGSIFELCTPLRPDYFLPLASLGNFTKAIARGLKDPSFRVIQNHFAISGNLGEVAAKEEVWEVVAQLFGLSLGILLLDTPGLQTSYNTVALTWLSVRMLHLWLRYQSLSVLRFPTVNLKRARILIKSHVLHKTVTDYVSCNKEEDILCWERFSQPRIHFGATLSTITDLEKSTYMVETLLKLYSRERYILIFKKTHSGGVEFIVSFKVGASSTSVLRSLWQTYWLNEHWEKESKSIFDLLEESLRNLEEEFDDFLKKLEGAGWNSQSIYLEVPKKVLLEEANHIEFISGR